jgi:hypothetical protein
MSMENGTLGNGTLFVECVLDTYHQRTESLAFSGFDGEDAVSGGAAAETTYWGVKCRTCQELVAFDVCPYLSFGVDAASMKPGAIRCSQDHNHIYFPRDFQFISSALVISDERMRANRETYRAINSILQSHQSHQGLSIGIAKRLPVTSESEIPVSGMSKRDALVTEKNCWSFLGNLGKKKAM